MLSYYRTDTQPRGELKMKRPSASKRSKSLGVQAALQAKLVAEEHKSIVKARKAKQAAFAGINPMHAAFRPQFCWECRQWPERFFIEHAASTRMSRRIIPRKPVERSSADTSSADFSTSVYHRSSATSFASFVSCFYQQNVETSSSAPMNLPASPILAKSIATIIKTPSSRLFIPENQRNWPRNRLLHLKMLCERFRLLLHHLGRPLHQHHHEVISPSTPTTSTRSDQTSLLNPLASPYVPPQKRKTLHDNP